MNITLYINSKNSQKLQQEQNKSGLVNKLLSEYYGTSSNGRTEVFEASNLGSSPSEPANVTGVVVNEMQRAPELLMARACCLANEPCKHWIWDGTLGLWKNTLSGKTREA